MSDGGGDDDDNYDDADGYGIDDDQEEVGLSAYLNFKLSRLSNTIILLIFVYILKLHQLIFYYIF
jgi:hypothetical protein